MPAGEIVVRRTYTFNDTEVLAREPEEQRLLRDMQTDMVQQIMRRLQSAQEDRVRADTASHVLTAMDLRPEQLDAHLAARRSRRSTSSTATSRCSRSRPATRSAPRRARAASPSARCSVVEPGFDWDAFLGANAQPRASSATRKLIDLRIPSGKPGVEGGKALEAYAARPRPRQRDARHAAAARPRDAVVGVVRGARATPASPVAVYPVERDALPGWIAARLARQRAEARRARRSRSSPTRCEGNLLAAHQEIQKLALLLPAGELALDAVEHAVADVARYDVFAAVGGVARRRCARARCASSPARGRGRAPTLAIWQLAEDVHALAAVPALVRAGTPRRRAVRNARVWGKRQAALERAVKRVAPRRSAALLARLARLDALAKGLGPRRRLGRARASALLLCGKPREARLTAPSSIRVGLLAWASHLYPSTASEVSPDRNLPRRVRRRSHEEPGISHRGMPITLSAVAEREVASPRRSDPSSSCCR